MSLGLYLSSLSIKLAVFCDKEVKLLASSQMFPAQSKKQFVYMYMYLFCNPNSFNYLSSCLLSQAILE